MEDRYLKAFFDKVPEQIVKTTHWTVVGVPYISAGRAALGGSEVW
jgi:hypothetical protein